MVAEEYTAEGLLEIFKGLKLKIKKLDFQEHWQPEISFLMV